MTGDWLNDLSFVIEVSEKDMGRKKLFTNVRLFIYFDWLKYIAQND